MHDDNITPTWALLWAHGISGGSRTGWTFAHVWTASDDINWYTHPANLVMVPECLASLTDKSGPLTAYLQWHAWTAYGWKPEHLAQPEMPTGYHNLKRRYFAKFDSPRSFVAQQIAEHDNKRVRLLRPIMEMRACCEWGNVHFPMLDLQTPDIQWWPIAGHCTRDCSAQLRIHRSRNPRPRAQIPKPPDRP